MTRSRWVGTMAVAGFVAALVTVLAGAPPAAAQSDCYPDGCTPPTGPPAQEVSCETDRRNGPPGVVVTATVVDGGGSSAVRLVFDGETVDTEVAPPPGDVQLSFEVPDVPPGPYDLVAVGDTYSVDCRANGAAGFVVTGGQGSAAGDGNPGGGQGSAAGDGNTGQGGGGQGAGSPPQSPPDGARVLGDSTTRPGVLPLTGGDVALLVVAAAGLVGVGTALRRVAGRRATAG